MRLSHLILALIVVLIWGLNFVVVDVGLKEIPPLLLGFLRFFLTSIPAVFFIKKPQAPFKIVALYGLVLFAIQFSLLFMGMAAGVTAGLASLLLQLQVFFTLLFAIVFFGEHLNRWSVLGAMTAFSGIALVALNREGSITITGFLLIIAAAAFWGVGNILSKKLGRVNMAAVVIWGSTVAWPPLLLICLLTEEGPRQIYSIIANLSFTAWGAVFYITYLSTLLGFGLWNWLVSHNPLATIAPFTLLVPVVGILSSVILLDEPLQLWKAIAALLVIGGLCINLLGPLLKPKFSG